MTDALRTCSTLSTVNGGGEGVTSHVLRIRLTHRSPWVSFGAYVPMLYRDVRRMRPGGEGACVTTLLEMPFGAQR